MVISVIFNT